MTTHYLDMKGIEKSFHRVKVLHGVDFFADKGEVVALCGENGAGKSTLMKILMGIYKKDSGRIIFNDIHLEGHQPITALHNGISMIHQELNLVNQLSVSRNIFLGREPMNRLGSIDFKRMNELARAFLDELNEPINPTTRVGELKVAQKQMVEIAKAISSDSKLIVMDEPTAVITEKETAILFKTILSLKEKGVSIIYISHRLQEIKQICDRVTILRDGKLIATKKTSEVTEHEIANLMVGREVENTKTRSFNYGLTDVALKVSNVSDNLLKNVSFTINRGEVVGFSGLIGAGRTELMEYIFGIRKVHKGEIYINGEKKIIRNPSQAIHNGVGFATEDRKYNGTVGIRSISDNINYCYLMKRCKFILSKRKIQSNNQSMIKKLRIVCQSTNQLTRDLSGGNQQKVILARWTLADADILILDEPTRGIDVGAREEIYKIINEMSTNGKTIIIISSDLPEIIKICPRIIVMYEGKIMGELKNDECTEEKIITLASGLSA